MYAAQLPGPGFRQWGTAVLALRGTDNHEMKCLLMGFDVGSESLREILLPESLNMDALLEFKLGASGDGKPIGLFLVGILYIKRVHACIEAEKKTEAEAGSDRRRQKQANEGEASEEDRSFHRKAEARRSKQKQQSKGKRSTAPKKKKKRKRKGKELLQPASFHFTSESVLSSNPTPTCSNARSLAYGTSGINESKCCNKACLEKLHIQPSIRCLKRTTPANLRLH
ncbi:hypothetical protein ACLB2K_028892 [Fragaria x ananassa]